MSTYAETPAKTGTADEKKLEKAKKRIKASRDAFQSQRDREESDLKFQVPELQWSEDAKKARMGGMLDGVATTARPILSISKLDQPIQLVQNQARMAKLGVNIHPVSEKASKETAEVLQGIYRRIERDSNADQARLWGFDRASKAGMGAYVVRTKWDEDSISDLDSPNSFDQEIVIDRVLYQSLVGFDPASQRPDFSDGEFAWVGVWITPEAFKREFPDAKYKDATEQDFIGFAGGNDSDWFAGAGDERKILVVDYWEKIHNVETLSYVDNEGETHTRTRDKVSVEFCRLTALEPLEEREWNGRYLPVIPVLGRELQPFGSERRWVGMIGPAKDGQRLFNVSASTFVESMLSEPKAPWMIAEGQEEGHESEFQQANIRNLPYIRYKPTSLNGQPVAPPLRTQIDTSKMQLAVLGMQEGDQMVQATTSIYDPSLGRENPRDKSGKAIMALQSQSDAGTSHFLASLADISLVAEARVILDMIPHIYDRPGRVSRILTGEDKDKVVMLNAPFVLDQDGRPQRAVPGTQGAQEFDLSTAGGYSVSVSIGKSFQTRLQQGSEQIGEILSAAPNLLPVIGDIYFKYQDIPGADEIAKRISKWREQMPGMGGLGDAEEGQPPTADQLQAKLEAAMMQMQQMGQQLQMAMKQIETDQAKQQAQILQAQLDSKTTLQKTEMDNAVKMAIARLNAQVQGGKLAETEHSDQVELGVTHAHETHESDKDRAHKTQLQREKLAHDVAMSAAGANTMKRTSERGQDEDREDEQESNQGQSRQPKPEAKE